MKNPKQTEKKYVFRMETNNEKLHDTKTILASIKTHFRNLHKVSHGIRPEDDQFTNYSQLAEQAWIFCVICGITVSLQWH